MPVMQKLLILQLGKAEIKCNFGNEITLSCDVKKKESNVVLRKNKKRIMEICHELDVDIYWKDCNFLENEENDEIPTFYSRDECHSISFRELLLWYIPRLGRWQDSPNCNNCNRKKCKDFTKMNKCKQYILDCQIKDRHYALFLELAGIYFHVIKK